MLLSLMVVLPIKDDWIIGRGQGKDQTRPMAGRSSGTSGAAAGVDRKNVTVIRL
jgi:hypothetical protein